MNKSIVVGITGASGAPYAVRLVEALLAAGRDVHLSISPSGREVIRQELDLQVDLSDFAADSLISDIDHGRSPGHGKLHYHHYQNFLSPVASGSFLTGGMVVCPCSGTTLSAIAAGAAGNLIQRAAEVHLKEHRRLVLVPRETPLSLPAIDNMRRASEAGAVVLPASPGWYHGVTTLQDLVDFVVARILDQLEVENALIKRWGSE